MGHGHGGEAKSSLSTGPMGPLKGLYICFVFIKFLGPTNVSVHCGACQLD
jgi:hypothetical protein